MNVEVLYFSGCPSYEALIPRLRELVSSVSGDPDALELHAVETPEAADELRFLGSPTVRIDGRDVDPTAGERDDFGLKCRIYHSDDGQTPVPPEDWIRNALAGAAR